MRSRYCGRRPERVTMPEVDWAVLCDLAYFDTYGNLCLIGIHTDGPVRVLPAGVHRLSIAAHVNGHGPDRNVILSITTPHGPGADGFEDVHTSCNGEYVLCSIARVPLVHEGVYRFDVSMGAASLDIPVLVTGSAH